MEKERILEVYTRVFQNLVEMCHSGSTFDTPECREPDNITYFSDLARITATTVVSLNAAGWSVEERDFRIWIRIWGADPVWYVWSGPVATEYGPYFISMWRPLYDFEGNDVKVPGMERITPGLMEDPAAWEEFEREYPEAARYLSSVLRILLAATRQYETLVILKFGKLDIEASLNYIAILPGGFDEEDILAAIGAMEWVYARLLEMGFPLYRVDREYSIRDSESWP